jgi:acetolactate synthase I/II/III large subunit
MTSTTPGGSATREAAEALTGVETTARSVAEAAAEPLTGITGAQSLVRSLEAVGVEVVFGIPGGAILPAYDPLFDSRVRHVLVRHEQGAGHAATGYAQATGRVGVCMATSGPGATNLVTPLADAYMDSVPMVAITGQVPSAAIGTDAFQEADIRGITMPITKHNFLVTDADEIPQRIAEAFHLAATGRPGPVLVDIAKDALQATTDFSWPPRLDLPGYKPTTRPHGKQVREAAALVAAARRPVLYVGGGVIKAQASAELAELAELTGAPVVTTLMARGAFPDSHPQNLGMPGMHGNVTAVTALQKADLLVALGARFDDRVTGQLSSFAPEAKVVHADIDPAEIGKNRKADVPIVGDARETIAELVTALRAERDAGRRPDLSPWWAQLDQWRQKYPLGYDWPEDGALSPQYVIERLGAIAGPDAIYASGVGQHQMWAAQFIRHLAQQRRPRDDGVRRARGDGRQVRLPGHHRVGDRRRRLLPDDQPGAGHLCHRGDPGQGRRDQQRQPRHGPPVADPLLRGPLLQHQAAPGRRRGPAHAGAHPRLRGAGRGAGLRRPALREQGRRRRRHREGDGHRRRPGGHRLHRRCRRPGVADGGRGRQQRRHPGRAGRPPGLRRRPGLAEGPPFPPPLAPLGAGP